MRHIHNRLRKLKEAIRPDNDMFTFEELCRSLWQGDRKAFKNLVNQQPLLSIFVAQFELEEADALRAAKAARSRHRW